MMIQKIIFSSSFVAALLIQSCPSIAGVLYRFPNEEGVPTLSRDLPPSASQKGYDILDDETFRLIEHVAPALTEQEIIELELELERQRQLEEEAKRQAILEQEQAAIAEKRAERERQKQAINDQNLIASYSSEQELLKARDESLNHRQVQLKEIAAKQVQLKQQLLTIQKQAADQELRGAQITPNLKNRLSSTQQEINNNVGTIERLNQEITQLTEQFAKDLIRFKELLQAQSADTNEKLD